MTFYSTNHESAAPRCDRFGSCIRLEGPIFTRVSSDTRSENVLGCGLYIFDARLYIRVFPSLLIVNIAKRQCNLDVGPILLRKPKKSREALSVPFPSTFGNRGPKVGQKGRMALFPVFSHMFGKANSILQSTVED